VNWKICFVMVLAIAIGQAEDQPAKKKKSAPKPAAATAELKLPAGATLVEPGTYTYTDSQGKKWIYRKTPFGLAKTEDKPAPAAESAPATDSNYTAVEDGDSIRFERPGPFGVYKWQKKKSDLTEDEKAAWERSQKKSASIEKAKQE
jgi:hypothetical protein